MEKTVNDFSWKIAGAAGDGILNAGLLMFAKTCVRSCLYVFASAEYPSLIRGGHNHLDVRVRLTPVHSHTKGVDILVALNEEAITKHQHKLTPNGAIIYDGTKIKAENVRDDVKLYNVPLEEIAVAHGNKIMRNTVAIGVTFSLLDGDLNVFNDVIRTTFGRKGEEVVQANINAAKAGFDYLKKNFENNFKIKIDRCIGKNIFLSGHEALSLGALKAGCKFFAGYPMTPASSIMHNMASYEKPYNVVVKHTEDEIAAINMAVGASFAGVRSMTATSGGGFCLMTEGFGLAAQTETPLVVVESQRPGPGSGMATHTGQGDLKFMLHASTDESPRVVMAPGDVDECFYKTIDAFNLADKYQIPVIIMTDKYIGESYRTTTEFDTSKVKIERGEIAKDPKEPDYKRYKNTESGVSPRSIPSQEGGMHIASSYEHSEHGFETEEEKVRIMMHNKRFRKFENLKKEIPPPKLQGPEDADITIISWGSTKGCVTEAMKLLEKDGIKTNHLHVLYISPFHEKEIGEIIRKAKKTVIVENNKTSQLGSVIKENTGLDIDHKVLKYDGRPFYPEEIYQGIKEIA
ncbi:MAG: 2-oxoacid:acceptor oxidoreductase subunit alpha [Candidatus Aenigmatarchaeota archaeon]|nr:2-oxoacid:acceptor oxidoreductase subunit alpha [Nanoarchaeota archaeon]